MITPGFVCKLAAYNAEMNRRLYEAAANLDEVERRADRGAFWGSIQGTLSHLVWADRMWMSRFDGGARPPVALPQSAALFNEFAPMRVAREAEDERITAWAGQVTQDWLDGELSWFSGATQSHQVASRALLVIHVFNHQTHHRGQVHALLTRAGQATGATDLFVVVP
jgi:uncharacterized damage-inducible protein DinB